MLADFKILPALSINSLNFISINLLPKTAILLYCWANSAPG